MHDLDRIEHLLATKLLSHQRFERCAQDLLSTIFPGLTPIPGGTDWGRDADVATADGSTPPRLLATTSRHLEGIRKNMLSGLNSAAKHHVPVNRIILANPASLSLTDRNKLVKSAARKGARLDTSDIFDCGFFASKLRRDGYWRENLLGLSSQPITLSRTSPDVAESPWGDLPLVGRDEDLARLREVPGDVVVTGPAGAGKSRLLQDLQDVVFVDKDASYEQVADDLRWLSPKTVVVDDAGQAESLVKRLLWLRRNESDVFDFRILTACWPDEVEHVSDWLTNATRHEVGLLERSVVDEIVVSMGITRQIARVEVLDQAEGRPGWAVALCDLLLRTKDPKPLLTGSALLGAVTRYLRRAGLAPEAVDVLAIVAALDGISDVDISEVASELEISRTSVAQLLSSASRSGLIDVELDHSRIQERRYYEVRPPKLAGVLVAEQAFASDAPIVDLDRLANRWPDKLAPLAKAAINAAHLGATGARPAADNFFQRVMTSGDVESAAKVEVASRYAYLDRAAVDVVIALVRSEFDGVLASNPEPWALEPMLRLASLAARRYLLPEAVTILLDAAVLDRRPPHSYPDSAIRQLESVVHSFHPELPVSGEQRDLVAEVIDDWIAADPSARRWQVYGEQVENVLSLHLSSSQTAPGDPRALQIFESVVNEMEIERIYKELWPPLRARLAAAPATAVRSAITAAEDWLRIGGGYDRPFGHSHPQSALDAARSCGKRLLVDLGDLSKMFPGLTSYLNNIAARFGMTLDDKLDSHLAPFFADMGRAEDWREEVEELRLSIAHVVQPWADEEATQVASRLVGLREQLELSSVRWPDRISLACTEIAQHVSRPLDWLDAATNGDLLPEASAFIQRVYEQGGELGEQRLSRLLQNQRARWGAIEVVLTNAPSSDRRYVIESISVADYSILEALFLREQVSDELTRSLLTQTQPSTRPVVAASMFTPRQQPDSDWTPPLAEEWREAIEQLDMTAVPGLRDHQASRLTLFLANQFPDSLAKLLENAFRRGEQAEVYIEILPRGVWDVIYHVPWDIKDQLWSTFGQSQRLWLLLQHLVGEDADWLSHALDDGLVTMEQALSTYTGFEPHPSVEQLARLLVPRGVDPDRIAALAQLGSGWGEESERYGKLIEQFDAYASSADESVAAVGRAGLEMYKSAQTAAEAKERKKRVRGDL